jgi:hypothetical protein
MRQQFPYLLADDLAERRAAHRRDDVLERRAAGGLGVVGTAVL